MECRGSLQPVWTGHARDASQWRLGPGKTEIRFAAVVTSYVIDYEQQVERHPRPVAVAELPDHAHSKDDSWLTTGAIASGAW